MNISRKLENDHLDKVIEVDCRWKQNKCNPDFSHDLLKKPSEDLINVQFKRTIIFI